jgi:hypothetical protein
MSDSAPHTFFFSWHQQSRYRVSAGSGVTFRGSERLQHKLTTYFYPVSIRTTHGVPHTSYLHVSVVWCFVYVNNSLHVLHNLLVLSLTCSLLNSRPTATIYFSWTLHHSLYANIRLCWISSPFDKTSFTSKSANSRGKTFSTNNHSCWHTARNFFLKLLIITVTLHYFMAGCVILSDTDLAVIHIFATLFLYDIYLYIYSRHAYDWEELSLLTQIRADFVRIVMECSSLSGTEYLTFRLSLIWFNLAEYIKG